MKKFNSKLLKRHYHQKIISLYDSSTMQIGKYYKLFEHNESPIFPPSTHHLSCRHMHLTMVNTSHVHSIQHIKWFLIILNTIFFDVLKLVIEIILKWNIPIFFLFALSIIPKWKQSNVFSTVHIKFHLSITMIIFVNVQIIHLVNYIPFLDLIKAVAYVSIFSSRLHRSR